jgi:hypothetical protein
VFVADYPRAEDRSAAHSSARRCPHSSPVRIAIQADGSCYGLEPVDRAARQVPVVPLGRALALDERELTVAQDRRAQPTRGDRLSPLIGADPLCGRGRLIPPDGVEERVGLLLDEDHAAVDGLQKRFVDHVVKEVQQAVVKSLRVKERAGLGVAAELPPGPDLENLLQSADAAGQRDEGIREFGHERLALVHRSDDPKVVQAGVSDLALDQTLRDDPDYVAAGRSRRVGHRGHQPNGRATINQTDSLSREKAAQRGRGLAVRRTMAGTRPREDADSTQCGDGLASLMEFGAFASKPGRAEDGPFSRHPPDDGLVEAEIAAFDRFWQCQFFGAGLSCTQASDIGAPSAENVELSYQAFADIEAYGGAVPANVARSREARWGKGALPKGHPYDVKIDKA